MRKGCRAGQVGCNTRHCTLGLGLEVSQAGLDCNTCRHKLELGTGWKEACYSIHKGILRQGRPCQTRLGHPLAGSEPHAGCGWGLQCWTTALTSECKNWHWGRCGWEMLQQLLAYIELQHGLVEPCCSTHWCWNCRTDWPICCTEWHVQEPGLASCPSICFTLHYFLLP